MWVSESVKPNQCDVINAWLALMMEEVRKPLEAGRGKKAISPLETPVRNVNQQII